MLSSSLVCRGKMGGHLPFIRGTWKRGKGAVHMRSILGRRGKYPSFSKRHGLRDGSPDGINKVKGALGMKLGGGLFGCRRPRGSMLKGMSVEDFDLEVYGHPNITNPYAHCMHLHPALDRVTARRPLCLEMVVVMPPLPRNSPVPAPQLESLLPLPRLWQQSVHPIADLCRRAAATMRDRPLMAPLSSGEDDGIMINLMRSSSSRLAADLSTSQQQPNLTVHLATTRASIALRIPIHHPMVGGRREGHGQDAVSDDKSAATDESVAALVHRAAVQLVTAHYARRDTPQTTTRASETLNGTARPPSPVASPARVPQGATVPPPVIGRRPALQMGNALIASGPSPQVKGECATSGTVPTVPLQKPVKGGTAAVPTTTPASGLGAHSLLHTLCTPAASASTSATGTARFGAPGSSQHHPYHQRLVIGTCLRVEGVDGLRIDPTELAGATSSVRQRTAAAEKELAASPVRSRKRTALVAVGSATRTASLLQWALHNRDSRRPVSMPARRPEEQRQRQSIHNQDEKTAAATDTRPRVLPMPATPLDPLAALLVVRCFTVAREMSEQQQPSSSPLASSSPDPSQPQQQHEAPMTPTEWSVREALGMTAQHAHHHNTKDPSTAPWVTPRTFTTEDVLLCSRRNPLLSRQPVGTVTPSDTGRALSNTPTDAHATVSFVGRGRQHHHKALPPQHPQTQRFKQRVAAVSAACPLIEYVADETSNAVTAGLRQRHGVIPVRDDAYAALAALHASA